MVRSLKYNIAINYHYSPPRKQRTPQERTERDPVAVGSPSKLNRQYAQHIQLLDVLGLVLVLDGEAELDHAVDAAGEGALQPRSRQLAAAGTAADT